VYRAGLTYRLEGVQSRGLSAKAASARRAKGKGENSSGFQKHPRTQPLWVSRRRLQRKYHPLRCSIPHQAHSQLLYNNRSDFLYSVPWRNMTERWSSIFNGLHIMIPNCFSNGIMSIQANLLAHGTLSSASSTCSVEIP